MQQICFQLIFNGKENIPVSELSPWFDNRLNDKKKLFEKLENQTHRRVLKTHAPLNTIKFSNKAKYIYIGRDGRDVAFSYYNHYKNYKDFTKLNEVAHIVGNFYFLFYFIFYFLFLIFNF